jgi:type I restriction enzyme S subunit
MKAGWQTTTLGDACRFIDYRGRTPEKTASGLRLITAKNVKMGFLQMEPLEFIAPETYESWMTRGIPQMGDVLFTTEAPLANVAQLDTSEKVVFAQRIIVLQPHQSNIDRTFLKYLLLSDVTQRRIHEKGTGATVKGIKASLLKTIEIAFPPLPEQQRIVGILDEAFDGIATAKANAERNLQNARALFESHLQSVFTQRGDGWVDTTIGEQIRFIDYRGKTPEKTASGYASSRQRM